MRTPSGSPHPDGRSANASRPDPTVLSRRLRDVVRRALDPDGAAWFVKAQQRIEADRTALVRLFPAVSRKCGRAQLWPVGPDLVGWTVDDAVRTLLLIGASIDEVTAVYTYGDPAEQRAVLRALPLLNLGDAAVPLVLDALCSNDRKLIAAAVGPYAAAHLPADSWREAVFICITRAVPLAWVADLKRRADAELVGMLRAYGRRRRAAGLSVPPDLLRLVPDLRTGTSATAAGDAAGHDAPPPAEPTMQARAQPGRGKARSPRGEPRSSQP